jgi:hypothetical protein
MSKMKDMMYQDRVEGEDDNSDTSQSEAVAKDEALIINNLMGSVESVRNSPRVKVIIHNQDGENGNQPVFVSLNGMGYKVPREVPVMLPLPIVEVLQQAVETQYHREVRDGKQFGPIVERYVPRFPMSISDASF